MSYEPNQIRKGDILTELRFYVPNIDKKITDDYDAKKKQERSERRKARKPESKKDEKDD